MSIAVSIVIPARNEAAHIERTLRAVRARVELAWPGSHEVIVVDDGSSDATSALARHAGARVLVLPQHRGKGAAVRAGMLAARGDIVAFMDADGAIPIEQVEKLVAAVQRGADVAVASRRSPGAIELGHRSYVRTAASAIFRLVVKRLAPSGVRDPQCGAKAFSRAAATRLCAEQTIDGFAFDVELVLLARRADLSIEQVPVTVRYEVRPSAAMLLQAAPMVVDLLRVRRRMIQRDVSTVRARSRRRV